MIQLFTVDSTVQLLTGSLAGHLGRVLSSGPQSTRVRLEAWPVTATVPTVELEAA